MNLESYFEPALRLSRLIYLYNQASGEEKAQLGSQIYHSEYLTRLRTLQSISGVEFLQGRIAPQKVNTIKKDFFYNPAIPSTPQESAPPEMPYHRHDYLELVVVLQGHYTQSINGILHRHGHGEVCLLNPNVIHRDVVPGPDDRILFLGLSQNYLQQEMVRGAKLHPELSVFLKGEGKQQYILFFPPVFEQVEELIGQLLEEDTKKLPGHHAIISGLLIRFFSMLADGRHFQICRQSQSEIHENLIAEVLRYMSTHLEDLTREDLAAFFHFNPDYLNRLLQEVTGRSYSAHMREMRLDRAADQLLNTNSSVNSIIQSLGFSNKGYFNRVFQEKFGVLPGQYRRQS